MDGKSCFSCFAFLILFVHLSASSPPSDCPVNFKLVDYSVITSQCKGPRYPADQCCAAFKQFACPYADLINDLRNDCASVMFSYLNLYGKYPPGLLASMCREGKEGLQCPALSPKPSVA